MAYKRRTDPTSVLDPNVADTSPEGARSCPKCGSERRFVQDDSSGGKLLICPDCDFEERVTAEVPLRPVAGTLNESEANIKIPVALAAKLAAVVVHADEMLSGDGHNFDRVALESIVRDPQVQAWVVSLGALAPVKRRAK